MASNIVGTLKGKVGQSNTIKNKGRLRFTP